MLKAKIFGYDLNKKGSEAGEVKIPECIGFAAAVSFCIIGGISTVLLRYFLPGQ